MAIDDNCDSNKCAEGRSDDVEALQRKTIVVFYHARYHLPLRATNEAHLLCWKRYSRHRVVYINVGFGVPWLLLRRLSIDAVIFDTIFLSMHWSPDYFLLRTAPCIKIAELDCPKIAIVQDEFYNLGLIVEFLSSIDVTHILTCSDKSDWDKLYGKLDLNCVKLRTVLTGYVDEVALENLSTNPLQDRPIDIGYRAWDNPYWLGAHGQEKVRIGHIVGEAARKRGLKTDINNPAGMDFLVGEQWYEFLCQCEAVLGVEGGASVLDWDGSIKQRVETYLAKRPSATFEEVSQNCFPGQDGEIGLACLSPRHLEACMTRTCQLLLEGRYNGIFEAWKHYIPIKKDYSNLDEVIDALQDSELVRRIVDQAYEDIVSSGKWSYRSFVRDIEQTIIDSVPPVPARSKPMVRMIYSLLRVRDDLLWRFAHMEASNAMLQCRGVVRQVWMLTHRDRWLAVQLRTAVDRLRRIFRWDDA